VLAFPSAFRVSDEDSFRATSVSPHFLNLQFIFAQGLLLYYCNYLKVTLIKVNLLGVQLCFRRFPIDGFSGKW